MTSLKNTVTLIGNLGQDVDFKELDGDKKVAKFSLAVNENYKTKSGAVETKTEWFNLIAWGKTAEIANNILKKGHEVIVKGKLKNNNYVDKDGNKRFGMDIIVSQLYCTTKKD